MTVEGTHPSLEELLVKQYLTTTDTALTFATSVLGVTIAFALAFLLKFPSDRTDSLVLGSTAAVLSTAYFLLIWLLLQTLVTRHTGQRTEAWFLLAFAALIADLILVLPYALSDVFVVQGDVALDAIILSASLFVVYSYSKEISRRFIRGILVPTFVRNLPSGDWTGRTVLGTELRNAGDQASALFGQSSGTVLRVFSAVIFVFIAYLVLSLEVSPAVLVGLGALFAIVVVDIWHGRNAARPHQSQGTPAISNTFLAALLPAALFDFLVVYYSALGSISSLFALISGLIFLLIGFLPVNEAITRMGRRRKERKTGKSNDHPSARSLPPLLGTRGRTKLPVE